MVILWTVLMLLGFAGSAVYSGLETGIYRLNRVRLHLLEHEGHAAARRLRAMIAHPTALLTTLLVGNNIANYLGTAGMTRIMDAWQIGPWQIILLNTVIVTPILFVFGETLPKDLFANYSDRLTYPLTPFLTFSQRAFTVLGLVPLISAFTNRLTRLTGGGQAVEILHPRRVVESLVKDGVGYGLLSDDQSAIVERVLTLVERTVGDEMVPWDKVDKVRHDATAAALWQLARSSRHGRFPVVDAAGKVIGQVRLLDVLLHEPEQCPPVTELMSEHHPIKANCPLATALGILREHHIPMAIVVSDRHPDRPVGLVTVKDVVEPITGELAEW